MNTNQLGEFIEEFDGERAYDFDGGNYLVGALKEARNLIYDLQKEVSDLKAQIDVLVNQHQHIDSAMKRVFVMDEPTENGEAAS